jgi:PAS domain S-box-containing protein
MASMKKNSKRGIKRGAPKEPETLQSHPAQSRTFPVVGIGASAGGLEAFRQLLEHLPTDTGMAFVLVQHLDPERESILAELMSKTTKMSVKEVKDGMLVEPDCVYVIPRNTNMAIENGALRLSPREAPRGRRRTIDHFLRSLAVEKRDRAIGVILSGTASDGTRGLEVIKAVGGITFAQDEKTAEYDGMPRSAINAGCVDFVLPPERIAEELARLAGHPHDGAVGEARREESLPPYGEPGGDGASLDEVLWLVREASGLDFSHYQPDIIQSSVNRRMTLLNLDGLVAYADYLCGHNVEAEKLYQEFRGGVTGFFREPGTFEALKEKVFPELVKRRVGDEPLRVWIVGCSTGEEVYSIAIAFLEFTENRDEHIPIKIFATDLSNDAIMFAREGLYSQSIVNDVSPERLRRFFVKTLRGYRISKQVRGLCVFARHNILTDTPFSRMDMVGCGDLLIRLTPAMRKKAIHTLHYSLKPSGLLLSDSSEVVGELTNLFKLEDDERDIYSRIPGPSYMLHRLLPGADSREKVEASRRAIQALEEADIDAAGHEEAGRARDAKAGKGRESDHGQVSAKLSEAQLRRKLHATREYLRSVIEQHEAYAEELQSANEELQSSNEELRCVSEELETAKQELQLRNEQLREDKEKLGLQTSLIESSVEPIYIWDFDKDIVEWNQGCERLYGYTRAEAVGRNNHELLRTVFPLPLEEFDAQLVAQREWTGELCQTTKDGREVIVESRKTLTETDGRRLVLVTNHDITERKRAELNTQFINQLDLGISRLADADEIIQLTTSKLGEYLGVARCRVVEITPALSLVVVHEEWEGWLHGASSIAGEYRIGVFAAPELQRALENGEVAIVNDVKADPRTRDFAHNYEPLGVGAFIIVPSLHEKRWETTLSVDQPQARDWRPDEAQLMRDICVRLRLALNRARTVEALRESEARARRTMADQMVAGVAECDVAGRFTLVNQRYCDIVGYIKAELLELRMDEIAHPADWPHNAELYRRLYETGESFFIEKRYCRKDGSEVWVNSHVSPIRNAWGKIEGSVAVVIDVTGRKRGEQEREQLLEQEKAARAEAQAANQSKDEFLAVVSHELRNPLSSILGYARLLRAETASAAQIKHLLGIIERNGRMQLQLIEDLLDTSRIISGKLELEIQPVDLVTVITAALDVAHPSAQAKGISITTNLDSLAGQITGDPDRLQQVVWNLLSNAIKFTPEGGSVELTLKRADSHIAIVVRDNGKGIESEFLPHVFERFRQADMSSTRRVGGLGLGLSLVKHLVESHGGTIEVESAGAGQGATFTVRLPLRAIYAAPPEEREALDAMLSARSESLAGVRALIVDDEEEVRTTLTLTLQNYGAQAQAVASGTEALEMLARQTPDDHFDAIICDIGMPDEDGYTVMRKVRALPPEKGGAIPAIALTAYGRAEDRVRALAAGFHMHVAKPIEPDELAVVILSLFNRFNTYRARNATTM